MIIKNGQLVTLLIKCYVISLSALIKLNGEKFSKKTNPFYFMLWSYHKIAQLRCFIFLRTFVVFQVPPPLRSFIPFHSSCGVCCRLGTFPKFGHRNAASVKKSQVWCSVLFNFDDFRAISIIAATRRETPNGRDQFHRRATFQWRRRNIA